MYKLTFKAETFKELQNKILEAAQEIQPMVPVQTELVVAAGRAIGESIVEAVDHAEKLKNLSVDQLKEIDKEVEESPVPAKRGRRKKEVEPVAEVQAPPPTVPTFVPPVIPPMPVAPPTIPSPMPQPKKGFEHFKDNVVTIFAGLVQQGKIDQHYVTELKKYFGVAEIWDAFSDENKVKELYENFCNYGFITRE